MTAQPAMLLGFAYWTELIVVLIAALILFGAKRLPELARSLGKSLRIFKSELKNAKDEFSEAVHEDDESDAAHAEDVPNKAIHQASESSATPDDASQAGPGDEEASAEQAKGTSPGA